jgi:hypothetical protein
MYALRCVQCCLSVGVSSRPTFKSSFCVELAKPYHAHPFMRQ